MFMTEQDKPDLKEDSRPTSELPEIPISAASAAENFPLVKSYEFTGHPYIPKHPMLFFSVIVD